MSMTRRILRHVPGGVVASVGFLISFLIITVLSQLRKNSLAGLEPTTFQSGYRCANHYAIATRVSNVPVKCLQEFEKSWAKEYVCTYLLVVKVPSSFKIRDIEPVRFRLKLWLNIYLPVSHQRT